MREATSRNLRRGGIAGRRAGASGRDRAADARAAVKPGDDGCDDEGGVAGVESEDRGTGFGVHDGGLGVFRTLSRNALVS